MSLNCGIIGLPNVGKSTLFNALTATAAAEAANYPFCTIEPNVGRVCVPDGRLDKLAAISKSEKIVPVQLEFVDIAGIVQGASEGAGLGNKFLSNIRDTDAIVHVVRCFDNDDVTHVSGKIDPIADIKTVEAELILADMESVERRIPALEKKAKIGEIEAKEMLQILQQVDAALQKGMPAFASGVSTEKLKLAQLISSKPIMYVCNVDENDLINGNAYTDAVAQIAGNSPVVKISARIESEIATLESKEEQQEFLASIGCETSGLCKLVRCGYALLGLITFFTSGPKESRAWSIKTGTKAPQAAGIIHTDFERGFICAETVSCDDFIELGGEAHVKNAGKMRLEGKDYIVQDGDVMHFRFNVYNRSNKCVYTFSCTILVFLISLLYYFNVICN